jgi:cytochrome c-type biogenesis protein CcmH/NrfF
VVPTDERVVDLVLDASFRQIIFEVVKSLQCAVASVVSSDTALARDVSHKVGRVKRPMRI